MQAGRTRRRYAPAYRGLGVLMVAALALAGCDREEPPAAGPASAAAHAATVTTPQASTEAERTPRIAVLSPFAADVLLALGVEPAAVPVLRGAQPPSWDGIPTFGLEHGSGPNLEQIAAVDPDVIVTSATYAQFLPQLRTLGVSVVEMDVRSVQDLADHTRELGELTGREEQAEQLVAEVQQSAGGDEGGSRSAGDGATDVLAVFGAPGSFYAFLPDSYLGDLIERAGGRLVTEGMAEHRVFRGLSPLSMEAVVAMEPDVVLLVTHGPAESALRMFNQDPAWQELAAIRDGRVRVLADDLFVMRPGAELTRAQSSVRTALEEASAGSAP